MTKRLPDHLFNKEFCGPLPITPDLRIREVDGNWVTGIYKDLWFQAKVFSEVSEFGLNNGRVSKLCISKAKEKPARFDEAHVLFNFERGMDLDNPLGHELASHFDAVI